MTLYRKYKNYELTGFQRAYVKWMVVLGILPDKRIKMVLRQEKGLIK